MITLVKNWLKRKKEQEEILNFLKTEYKIDYLAARRFAFDDPDAFNLLSSFARRH